MGRGGAGLPTRRPAPALSEHLRNMEDADFSDSFCRFIQTTIPAVDAAELLLLLADQPGRHWTLPEAVAKLRPATQISDAEAARYLDLYAASGLVATHEDRRIQYRPESEDAARHVCTLAKAYEERPVTLVRVIYALRDTKIQSFAEAFKLRKR